MKTSLWLRKMSFGLSGAILLATPLSNAIAGGASTGGGDLCEDRIKMIRDDITSWIHKGGSAGLRMSREMTAAQYADSMLQQLNVAKIRCVGPQDAGFPVVVEGTPKVCRFDRSALESQITCDIDKFKSMNESDQYVLIHHEFAGLAGIELPNGADSDYQVSNQISEYLVDEVVKRLGIKSQAAQSPETGPIKASGDCTVILSDDALSEKSYISSSLRVYQEIPHDFTLEEILNRKYAVQRSKKEKFKTDLTLKFHYTPKMKFYDGSDHAMIDVSIHSADYPECDAEYFFNQAVGTGFYVDLQQPLPKACKIWRRARIQCGADASKHEESQSGLVFRY